MSNVLSDEKRQQVLALGRLEWALRRIEQAAGVRRETASWEERRADTRIHGTTKRQVATMFAEEKPALLPLPLEPFRSYQIWQALISERYIHSSERR